MTNLSDTFNGEETTERRHRELIEALDGIAGEIMAFNYFMQETLRLWNPNPEIKVECNHSGLKPRATSKGRKA